MGWGGWLEVINLFPLFLGEMDQIKEKKREELSPPPPPQDLLHVFLSPLPTNSKKKERNILFFPFKWSHISFTSQDFSLPSSSFQIEPQLPQTERTDLASGCSTYVVRRTVCWLRAPSRFRPLGQICIRSFGETKKKIPRWGPRACFFDAFRHVQRRGGGREEGGVVLYGKW